MSDDSLYAWLKNNPDDGLSHQLFDRGSSPGAGLFNKFEFEARQQRYLGLLPEDLWEAQAIVAAREVPSEANNCFKRGLDAVEQANKLIGGLTPDLRHRLQSIQLSLCQAETAQEGDRLRGELRREFPDIYKKMDAAKELLIKGVKIDAAEYRDRLQSGIAVKPISCIAGEPTWRAEAGWRLAEQDREMRRPAALVRSWLRNEINNFDRPGPDKKAEIQADRMLRLLEARGIAEELRARFRHDASRLKARNDISPQEIADTFDQCMSLMHSRGDRPVTQEERMRIAMQIVSHAAYPSAIDQGHHNTCNVATVQELMFTTCPSKAAKVIVSTILNHGKWTSIDGKEICVDAESLRPGLEEIFPYPPDGARSHASQIFQLVAVNDAAQRRTPAQFYRQREPVEPGDTGERLTFADGTQIMQGRTPVHEPAMGGREIAAVGYRMTGDKAFLVAHASMAEGKELVAVKSAEELLRKLESRVDLRREPAVLVVDANHPIFGGSGKPNTYGSWHVVSIVGVDAASQRVRVSNQWGQAFDGWVPLADLFQATQGFPPKKESGRLSWLGL